MLSPPSDFDMFLTNADRVFLEEGEILANLDKISNIPTTIIQGRYDMICPMISANELAFASKNAVLNVVDDAGHSAMEPGIRRALVEATNTFRDKGRF